MSDRKIPIPREFGNREQIGRTLDVVQNIDHLLQRHGGRVKLLLRKKDGTKVETNGSDQFKVAGFLLENAGSDTALEVVGDTDLVQDARRDIARALGVPETNNRSNRSAA